MWGAYTKTLPRGTGAWREGHDNVTSGSHLFKKLSIFIQVHLILLCRQVNGKICKTAIEFKLSESEQYCRMFDDMT